MATLLLRLTAPLQAWGSDSKFNIRNTEREPTKSGVIGMIAAALGIQRNNSADKLRELSALKFGIRVDREGKLLKDFHMVHEPRTGKGEPQSHLTTRYYLSDAVFIAAFESDNTKLLEEIGKAVQNPVYPMFLGRRSCPPTLPIFLGIREKCLVDALKSEKPLIENDKPVRISFDSDAQNDDNGIITESMVHDVPVSFSQLHRQHGFRMKNEEILNEHDAFGELEV